MFPIVLQAHFIATRHPTNDDVFTPEQDNDKTTRQMSNLCIPMMPFTPGLSDLV